MEEANSGTLNSGLCVFAAVGSRLRMKPRYSAAFETIVESLSDQVAGYDRVWVGCS